MFKKRLFLVLLTTTLITICNNFAVIILVHGSLAAKETWWHDDGKNQNFYAIVSQESAKYGYGTVVPFSWSGIPEESEINRAAELLAPLITSYTSEPLILIGHSHGGNVINKATQIAAQAYTTPKPFTNDTINPMDTTATTRCIMPYLIDAIYLLGTPIDTSCWMPNMGIVGKVVNLFSKGDMVQKVAGLYARTFPSTERIANCRVRIKEKNKTSNPGHSQLHDTIIAQFLLQIPDIASQAHYGNFNQFSFEKQGEIIFDKEKGITYKTT